MKRKNVLKCLSVGLLACTAFSACSQLGIGSNNSSNSSNANDNNGKNVPVYQGMTISSMEETKTQIEAMRTMFASSNSNNNKSPNGNNGNHYGWYKGDLNEKKEDIDNSDPFGGSDKNENIENEINDTFSVVGSTESIYYAKLNQDIYINVHINNPDNFEILSFTLNDKKYSSYMFEMGSDMETLILKYNVGAVSGIAEYTIDAIKYIDGTEIKDVLLEGDKTVCAGIYEENQVTSKVEGLEVKMNSISFDVDIQDTKGLIGFGKEAIEDEIKAVLYDGDTLVSSQNLSLGKNEVRFDNLNSNTLYQYAIVAYYDDLTGKGFGLNVLNKQALYTEAEVLFDNITIGQESINFNFLWNDEIEDKTIACLKLYKEEILVEEYSTTTTLDNLLSGIEYVLQAEYKLNGDTKYIRLNFVTEIKSTPTITLTEVETTKDTIRFEIEETDVDNVGEITKIELWNGDTCIEEGNKTAREFTGLLSGSDYIIKVTYVYDLNNGTGKQTIVKEISVATKTLVIPTIMMKIETTKDTIRFEIEETDVDNVGEITKIELWDGDTCIEEGDKTAREFTGLLSGGDYIIKVTYVYDLSNGTGKQTIVEEFSVSPKNTIFTVNGSTITGLTEYGETLKSLVIPKTIGGVTITTIGYTAFQSQVKPSFTSVIIPDSVITIEAGAFGNCHNLTSITIGNSVTSIGEWAFCGCYNLTSITIPDSVTSIGQYAFFGCSSLTSITIPDSVTSIGNSAFGYTSLMTIYYGGTAEQWTALQSNIGSNNESLTNATVYYYVENEADLPTDGGKYWHYVDGVPTAW